jgi:hypothetical protein
MQSRIRIGLVVGAIGLVLNICVAGFIGLCGPAVSLIGGAVAGFMAAQREKAATKSDGARLGATSGAVASGLILIGQVVGAVSALAYFQFSGTPLPFGAAPSLNAEPSQHIVYYASGIGTALCFGLIGAVLGALAGAATGYLGTPDPAPAVNP